VANCRRTAELTAYALRCQPNEVLVLSTGVIGRQLPMDKLAQGIATVTSPAAERGADAAARAIMTTDTRPKTASRMLETAEGTVTVSGFCKGAGMIHPNMATMLAILTTDAQLAPATLDLALRRAVNVSFNRISVDGDTSTNDTVLILASGASGVMLEGGPLFAQFVEGLTLVCQSLAKQVARDGEGATRLVEIHVTGARDEQEAHTVANSIARSPLVKTAVHGGDPNWGRVLCAAGYSGAAINQERLSLTFGPGDNDTPAVQVVANGLPTEADLSQAAATLRSDPVRIALDLGLGEAEATVWTCDLSAEYVVVNAHYTT
jgi:glutamate N-acetyltransferase/amino-acid N-acetyltransferase